MGEVYRARDNRLGRDVAIKVLPATFSSDPERLRRFEQEARSAAALNHPNIVNVYDVGTHDGSPYLVTELLAPNLRTHRVQAHLFDGYWQDLGTVKAYHEANLALATEEPPFDFHSPEGVIYTHMRNLPASQVRSGQVTAPRRPRSTSASTAAS